MNCLYSIIYLCVFQVKEFILVINQRIGIYMEDDRAGLMEERKMSLWGVGPLFVIITLLLTAAGAFFGIVYRHLFTITRVPFLFYAAGTVLVLFGLALWIPAGTQIDGCLRSGTLATRGVFGIVRNPIYSGIFFVLTGLFIASRSVVLIPVALPVYLLLKKLVKREEDVLLKVFGDRFRIYREEVNPVIPRLRSFRRAFFYPDPTGKRDDRLSVVRSGDGNFFIYTDGTGTIVIDTGYSDNGTVEKMQSLGFRPEQVDAVFLTHSDHDHTGGLPIFPQAHVYMGIKEADLAFQKVFRLAPFYRNPKIGVSPSFVAEGDTVVVGNISVQVMDTPGHTPGHTAYIIDGKYLFTGDAVLCQNGSIKPFYRILSMDHRKTKKSARKIRSACDDIHLLCTAHTGVHEVKT